MVNLFEEYPAQEAQKPESQGVNLFDEYNEENRPGTYEEAIELAKKKISEQHPNMPHWLRDAMLAMVPREQGGRDMLDSAARGVTNVTNYIPAIAGGALQGASIPIRGVAGMIPTEFTQKLANSPDLTTLFQEPETEGQKNAQLAAELVGGGGLFGKLFQGAKYAAQAAKIPKALQNASALATAGAVGTPGDATDRTIGAGGALALGGAGKVASKAAEKIAPVVRGLFNESTPESLIQSVQKPHDVLQRTANDLYGQVQGAIKNRGISTPISDNLIDQVKEHFPKNARSYKELLDKAKLGDYDAVHKIQSSLYKKGTKALASDDLAIENQGEDILDLRDKINEELNNHLIKEGHLDIAHVLSQGKKIYSDLQKTYFDKLLPKGLIKLVQPEMRLIPENPEDLFKQNSVPMKRFLERHPETAKHVKGLQDKNKAIKAVNNIMLKGAGTGGLLFTGKSIYDLLK